MIGQEPLRWPALAQLLRAEFASRWAPEVDGSLSAALAFSMLLYRLISHAKHWQSLAYPDVDLPNDWQSALRDILGDGRLLHRAGVAAASEGHLDQAGELLHRAAQASTDAEVLNDLAVVMSAQGRREEALSLLRACVVLEPGHAAAHANLQALAAEPQ